MTSVLGGIPAIAGAAHPVTGAADDYDALLDLVGDRRFVLIGEASHGTHEFYRERARITRRLIDELGFTAVAVEADWPDAYRVNRYVMGLSHDIDANTALADFRRFPAWMWRNHDVLRVRRVDAGAQRRARAPGDQGPLLRARPLQPAGLDRGRDPVPRPRRPRRSRSGPRALRLLRPRRARGPGLRLRARVRARDPVRERGRRAARRRSAAAPRRTSVATGGSPRTSCSSRSRTRAVVRDAEEYYQQMYRAEVSSWNLRDRHMAGTLDALVEHLDQPVRPHEDRGVGAQLARGRRARDGNGRTR